MKESLWFQVKVLMQHMLEKGEDKSKMSVTLLHNRVFIKDMQGDDKEKSQQQKEI